MFPDSISIIIPAYNEALRLPPTLAALDEWVRGCGWNVEVIIVVEPGTDRTRDIATAAAARQPNLRVIANSEHRGKGFAVRTGVLAATGDLVFYMDADLSVPLRDVDRFIDYFRAHPETKVMGQTFNAILRRLTGIGMHDTQCGFKSFRHAAAKAIFAQQEIDGFAFDVEVLLLAQRLGLVVRDLPVEWHNSPESKVHIVRDSLRMLRDAIRIRRRLAHS
jgi:dolichyl-phosphate beta-glucosyltransferase